MLPNKGRQSLGIDQKDKKNWLAPDTEISAAEMVLREKLAGRTKASDLLH
jgi:hypothetical protein